MHRCLPTNGAAGIWDAADARRNGKSMPIGSPVGSRRFRPFRRIKTPSNSAKTSRMLFFRRKPPKREKERERERKLAESKSREKNSVTEARALGRSVPEHLVSSSLFIYLFTPRSRLFDANRWRYHQAHSPFPPPTSTTTLKNPVKPDHTRRNPFRPSKLASTP